MKNKILLALASAFIISCGHQTEPEKAIPTEEKETPIESVVNLSPEQYKTLGVTLSKASTMKMQATLLLNGMLNVPPQYTLSINAPFGGFVKNLQVQEGSAVRKGQQLAFIENPEYIQLQQEYLENKSQTSFLEAEYQRQVELSKEQVNAQKVLQKAKAELDLNKAKLAGQKAKLQMLGIDMQKLEAGEISSGVALIAPSSGYVTMVKTNQGAYVGNTDVILEMMDAQHLYAELSVYEKDLAKLQNGQKVRLSLAGESKERTGTIEIIGRKVNEDRTVRVYCRFTQPDAALRPGMFLKGQVEISGYEALAVPEQALVGFGGKNYVFVPLSEHQFKMTEVNIGLAMDGFTEILSGLSPEQQVATKGAFQMLAALKNSGEE